MTKANLNPGTYSYLLNILKDKFPEVSALETVTPVSGGDINAAFHLRTGHHSFFLKLNSASRFPGMFEAEARGLAELAASGFISVPRVLLTDSVDDDAFLLMEFVKEGKKAEDFWENFGRKMAALHQISAESYGLDYDNYMGSLRQANRRHKSWPDFFTLERIEPQFEMAYNAGYFHQGERRSLERLCEKFGEYMPGEQPALLHGDLWSGNYLVDQGGEPVLIDPAVYYGHREADIAMMHLFGGFPGELFISYQEHFSLEKKWQERLDLYNLYPLLVHVNLFGQGYTARVKEIIDRFS